MKPVAYSLIVLVCLGLIGCETTPVAPGTLTKGEEAVRKLNLNGLKIGDSTNSLSRFAQVQRVPFGRKDFAIYEIYNPNPQISLALAYFSDNRLKRLEMRYFDGGMANTLSRSGGWVGLKNYLIGKFGPPSRTGANVPLATDVPGLKPQNAQFNGEWIFSRQSRRLNYIAFSDSKGGIAVVTLADTAAAAPAPTPVPLPIPTVATLSKSKSATGPASLPPKPASETTRTVTASPTPTPKPVPPVVPNPGF